ncbi:MAG TPA: ATP-binding cassette domain-containing protein [Vicinamibacterales bacterium]|nr:ATP-binding cassette domain-containing protein [Vicinamibacterales bacterium]
MTLASCQVDASSCSHLLCARSITRRYPALAGDGLPRGIQNVSLALSAGDRLALIGRSGSGKSTLARSLALLERVDAGEVWISGTNAWQAPHLAPLRRQVQLVLQDAHAAFNPYFTVVEAVEEPLRYGPGQSAVERLTRVRELLDLMHVPRAAADRFARDLSGGERRRVLVARALTTDPRVLILDETLVSLESDSAAGMLRTLFDLQAHLQFAIILIGHDLTAARHCDRAMLIDAGEICESGSVSDLFDRPQSTAGRAFATAARRIAALPC